MRKATKEAKRKKRKKALAKMAWYREHTYEYQKAKKMYFHSLKPRYPYTTSNY